MHLLGLSACSSYYYSMLNSNDPVGEKNERGDFVQENDTVSSVVFSFVEWRNIWVRMGLHLLLLPVIVSLTYELNRVVGRYDNRLTRLVSAPGMWLQNWTTFEPDDSMIEVGIRAFTLVLPEEKGKDQW